MYVYNAFVFTKFSVSYRFYWKKIIPRNLIVKYKSKIMPKSYKKLKTSVKKILYLKLLCPVRTVIF